MREELSRCKLELMQTQGIKAGLQQRIVDQDTTISQLKAEVLRKDLQRQNFDSEQVSVSCHDKCKRKQRLFRLYLFFSI